MEGREIREKISEKIDEKIKEEITEKTKEIDEINKEIAEKMKKIDKIIEFLGKKKADSLMISVDGAQSHLDSAIKFISLHQFVCAWRALWEAERELLEATLLWDEFLVKKEGSHEK